MSLKLERIGNDRHSVHLAWLAERSRLPEDDEQRLVLNPAFQRGAVWTLAQKQAWIESILSDLPLPAIFLNRFGDISGGHPKYGHKDVVIDGQQRIRATAEFLADEFEVRGEKFSTQGEEFSRFFRMNVVSMVIYTSFETEVECAKLYLKLLTAGTAHTEDELNKAKTFIMEQERSVKSRPKRRSSGR